MQPFGKSDIVLFFLPKVRLLVAVQKIKAAWIGRMPA
jgi:hypothetical protein